MNNMINDKLQLMSFDSPDYNVNCDHHSDNLHFENPLVVITMVTGKDPSSNTQD